jgi:hypothetical protein
MYYNRRNDRPGHLFQNRYRSILCEEDYYLKELIRYIHLNPLRAGLVKGLNELQWYRWCGHGAVAGVRLAKWQAVDDALEPFGSNYNDARSEYKRFVAEGVSIGRRPEYSRGGIIPGADGAEGASAVAELRGRTKCDERILGSGEFVANILRDMEHRDRRKMGLQRLMRPKDVVKRAAKIIGVKPGCVYARDRRGKPARARFLACKWLVEDLGVSVSGVARMLRITPAAVSHDVARGRQVEKEYKAKLK